MAVPAAAKPCNPLFCSPANHRLVTCSPQCCASIPQGQRLPTVARFSSSSSSSPRSPSVASDESETSFDGRKHSSLRYVNDGVFSESGAEGAMVSSASALVSTIRRASTSPVEFVQRIEKDPGSDDGDEGQRMILPSPDFQKLCLDQLDLFRRIIHPCALLSVYVRPAGSYIMDRLELRRVTLYPRVNSTDIVILVGNFSIPTGLRNAEAVLSNRQAEAIPESKAVVFPMVKHPFVVGFVVVELPHMELQNEVSDAAPYPAITEEYYGLPPTMDWRSQSSKKSSGNPFQLLNFTAEQRLNAINISRSLAVAYIMDQKAMLLQQTSWQNNVRMSNLVEQMRGPLSSIQTLVKMLTVHTKRNEDMSSRPKYLVAFTVGYNLRKNIDAAVKKLSKEDLSIVLFHYDGRTDEWDQEYEWSKRAIHISVGEQTKWWYAKRFLHPDIVALYEYIFVWDGELGVDNFNAEEYIKLVRKYGLEIS